MQQSPEGTETEYTSDPIDRPPSVSSPTQVFKDSTNTHTFFTFHAKKKSQKILTSVGLLCLIIHSTYFLLDVFTN